MQNQEDRDDEILQTRKAAAHAIHMNPRYTVLDGPNNYADALAADKANAAEHHVRQTHALEEIAVQLDKLYALLEWKWRS